MPPPVRFFLKSEPISAVLYEVRSKRGIAYESFLRLLLLLLLCAVRNIPYGKLCLQVRLRRMFSYIVGEGELAFHPSSVQKSMKKRGSPFEEPLSFIFFCEDALKPLRHSSLP